MDKYYDKVIKLQETINKCTDEDVMIAFSGGVDSSLLLKMACDSAIKKGNNLYILNCIMNHDSALRDSTIDYKNHIRRLENLFKARKIIYEDVPYVSIRLWCYKALFSLKLILSKKNIKYIKLIFS